ncbi:MAG TPA: hypothetical protein VFZ16_14940 [Hyphomicrobiaceae bacterium]|nr:hypothetical protein [Hyphomicrobiaceae bacterium]
MTVGESPAQGPGTGEDEPHEDVVISIKGLTAARMLARGETEAAKREALVRVLEARLQSIEAALGQRINEQNRLDRQVQDMHGKLARLGDELAQLRNALGNMPESLSTQGCKIAALQEKVDQLGALQQKVDQLCGLPQAVNQQLGTLQRKVEQQVIGLQGKSDSLQRSLDGALGEIERLRVRIASLENPPPGFIANAASQLKDTAGRLRKLHLGFGLWSALIALTLAAAAAGTAIIGTA